ncbi:MAG TPA: CAP domain-containing protein [Solirubrobacteraceae bacterium]
MPRRRFTLAVALVALALGAPSGALAADCPGADVVPAADNLALVGQATLCLVNDQRTSHGLRALSENAALSDASTGYSRRMVEQAFFAHESPDGGTLVERVKAVRYLNGRDDWVLGENIGWGQGPLSTARSMVNAWMNSAGHRANILSADYHEIGLGLALGTPPDKTWGATYTTDFGDPGTPPASAESRAAQAGAGHRRAAAHKKRRKAIARAACARAAHARSAKTRKRGRAALRRARKTCARLALV